MRQNYKRGTRKACNAVKRMLTTGRRDAYAKSDYTSSSIPIFKGQQVDDLQYNESGRARVSLELGRDVIEAIDTLRVEWGIRTRGAIVERLLQELLLEGEEQA